VLAERLETNPMRDCALFWFIVVWFIALPIIGLVSVVSWFF